MRAMFPTGIPTTLAAGALAASGMLGTLSASGTAVAASPAPAARESAAVAPADPAVRAEADRLMGLGYRQFAQARHVAPFNWTTDGCSVPTGQAPYSRVFRPACVQHDFGYRNYGRNHELKLDPTRTTKDWIDGRFRTEMLRICVDRYVELRRLHNCRNAAEVYYIGVRIGADKAFF